MSLHARDALALIRWLTNSRQANSDSALREKLRHDPLWRNHAEQILRTWHTADSAPQPPAYSAFSPPADEPELDDAEELAELLDSQGELAFEDNPALAQQLLELRAILTTPVNPPELHEFSPDPTRLQEFVQQQLALASPNHDSAELATDNQPDNLVDNRNHGNGNRTACSKPNAPSSESEPESLAEWLTLQERSARIAQQPLEDQESASRSEYSSLASGSRASFFTTTTSAAVHESSPRNDPLARLSRRRDHRWILGALTLLGMLVFVLFSVLPEGRQHYSPGDRAADVPLAGKIPPPNPNGMDDVADGSTVPTHPARALPETLPDWPPGIQPPAPELSADQATGALLARQSPEKPGQQTDDRTDQSMPRGMDVAEAAPDEPPQKPQRVPLRWAQVQGVVALRDDATGDWQAQQAEQSLSIMESPESRTDSHSGWLLHSLGNSSATAVSESGLKFVLGPNTRGRLSLTQTEQLQIVLRWEQGRWGIRGLPAGSRVTIHPAAGAPLEWRVTQNETDLACADLGEKVRLLLVQGEIAGPRTEITAPAEILVVGESWQTAELPRLPLWWTRPPAPSSLERLLSGSLRPGDLVTGLLSEQGVVPESRAKAAAAWSLALDPARAVPLALTSSELAHRSTALQWLGDPEQELRQVNEALAALRPLAAGSRADLANWLQVIRGESLPTRALAQNMLASLTPTEPLFVREWAIASLRTLSRQPLPAYHPAQPTRQGISHTQRTLQPWLEQLP